MLRISLLRGFGLCSRISYFAVQLVVCIWIGMSLRPLCIRKGALCVEQWISLEFDDIVQIMVFISALEHVMAESNAALCEDVVNAPGLPYESPQDQMQHSLSYTPGTLTNGCREAESLRKTKTLSTFSIHCAVSLTGRTSINTCVRTICTSRLTSYRKHCNTHRKAATTRSLPRTCRSYTKLHHHMRDQQAPHVWQKTRARP